MKYHIEKNSVQETLVIPLYGRKLCTERFPNLFQDRKAVELIERLDYDFSELENQANSMAHQFGALEVAMRETDLMCELKDYIEKHPKATLVNLGCGLDQTCENADNGQCSIVNIDLPDVIAVRNELLPASARVRNIACDLKDTSWFGEVDDTDGACFMAAGVFYYFQKDDVKKLFSAMEERFRGGRLAFDAANERAVRIMLKTWVKEAGITSINDYFCVSNAKTELAYLANTAISNRGYMLGYNDLKDSSVPGLFRLLAKLGDGFMKMQIVRLDFGK